MTAKTGTQIKPFDFRRSSYLPDDVDYALSTWLDRFCALVTERWSRHTSDTISWRLVSLASCRAGHFRRQVPETALAYRLARADSGDETLLVIPRPLLLGYVQTLLSESLTQLPDDRALTPVECALADLAVDETLGAFNESQPQPQATSYHLAGTHPLRWLQRLFPDQYQLVMAVFEVAGPFGSDHAHWLLPMQWSLAYAEQTRQSHPRTVDQRAELEPRIRKIPVELVVSLGDAMLGVSELADLAVGDVVILDRRVTEPLVAWVETQPVFLGYSGRVGQRQAFQIARRFEPQEA